MKGNDMFFDNTTNSAARNAIIRAHGERGKILGEVWAWMRNRG